jgi:hypothetical protein
MNEINIKKQKNISINFNSFDLQIHFVNIDGSRSAIQIGSQLNVKRGTKQVIPSDSIRIACTLN